MRRFLSRRVLGEFVAITGTASMAGFALGQDAPQAQPPKEQPAPSSQPAKPERPETAPATQEAMAERLQRLNEMRSAASRGAGKDSEPSTQLAPGQKTELDRRANEITTDPTKESDQPVNRMARADELIRRMSEAANGPDAKKIADEYIAALSPNDGIERRIVEASARRVAENAKTDDERRQIVEDMGRRLHSIANRGEPTRRPTDEERAKAGEQPTPDGAAPRPQTAPASNRWRDRTPPSQSRDDIRRRRDQEALQKAQAAAASQAAENAQTAPGAAPGDNTAPATPNGVPGTRPGRTNRPPRVPTPPAPTPIVPAPQPGDSAVEGGHSIEPSPAGKDVQVPGSTPPVSQPQPAPGAEPQIERHPAQPSGEPAIPPATQITPATSRPLTRPGRQPKTMNTPPGAATPGAVTPGEQSTVIDPQVAAPPPAEPGKTDWISFKSMPWEDVVRLMAKRIGKPYREDVGATPGGELTYENSRVMTKEEALDELNYLLVQEGAGYFLFETRYYVYCIPVNEIEKYLDPKYIFDSIEEFNAANLRDFEFVIATIRIQDMPAEKVRDALAPALPDYATPVVPPGTNSIKITGMAKDVRRFELLRSRIDPKEMAKQDPRTMKVYSIKTNVLVIERMVRDLLDVEQPQRKFDTATRQFVTQGAESATKIIADERTNTLIVKATPADHERVQALITEFDIKVEIGDFKTEVIQIKHGNATEIATLLNNIFNQERGQSAGRLPPRPQPPRNPNQPQQPGQPNVVNAGSANPEDIFVENIYERAKKTVRITADDRTNSLIVYANAEGQDRVNKMLEIIDKPMPSNYRAYAVKYVDPSDIQPLVDQLAKASAGARGGSGQRQPSVVADDTNKTLHVIAQKEDMERIGTLITQLDIPSAEEKEHRVELVNRLPSEMVPVIQTFLGGAGGQPQGRNPGQARQARRGGSGSTQQVIALDEIKTLIVFCTDEAWDKIRGTIELWDKNSISDKQELRFFTIDKGNPDAVAQTIGDFYRNYKHPILGSQPVAIGVTGSQVVVQGVKPALDEIEAFVAKLNVDTSGSPMVLIPLEQADAATVAQLLQQQFQQNVGNRGPRGGGRVPSVNSDGATNSIIFQGDKQSLELAKAFIKDYEDKLIGQAAEKRTFVIKYAAPNDVLNAVNQFFVNSSPRGPKAQVKVALSGNQLIVEAPKDKLPAIETMINNIDTPLPQPVTELRPVPSGLDINNLAQLLNTMFGRRQQQRPDRIPFSFSADPMTSMLVVTVPKDALAEVDAVIKQFVDQAGNIEQVEKFITIQHADVNYVSDQIKQLLQARSTPGRGASVADRVKTVVDSRLNRLGIYAPANLLPMVEELVQQIDQVTTGGEIQSIALDNADAQSAAQTISTLLAEKIRLNKALKITAEPLSNSIFVAGATKADFDDIKKQADQIDDTALANRPETRVFETKNTNPWEILNSLNQRFNQGGNPGRRQQPMTFNVVAGSKIVAVVPKDRMSDVAQYVAMLDDAGTTPAVQGITLKQADAGTVASILTNLLQPQMQTNRSLRIVPEPLSNTIFVSGAAGTQFEDIKKWSNELDQATLTSGATIRIFEIKNGNPQELISVLNSKYQPKVGQRTIGGNQPTFTIVGGTNIVASATPDKLTEIEKLVAQLDTLTTLEWPTVTYDLKYADPNETMQMINNLYRGKGNQSQQPQVTVANGTLVVRAPQKAQTEISELIKKIEVDRGDLAVEMFKLKVMRAQDLELKVTMFLNSLGTSQRKGQMKPGAFAEPATNTLIVMAPKEYMSFIKMLVNSIENQELPESEPKAYNLQFVRAEAVAQNVEAMLKAKVVEKEGPKNERIQLKVLPEPTTNRLLIWAPDEYHDLARTLLKIVDAQGESGEIVRILHLEQADATQMANTVKGRLTGPKAAQVNIVPDTGSNSLVVSGMPRDVSDVEKLVNELEPLNNTTPEMRIFKVKNTSATSISDALADIFPSGAKNPLEAVTVREDEFYNRLFVTANKRKMKQVEEIIKKIDILPDDDSTEGNRTLYFVDITRGDAWDIAYDVEDQFPHYDEGGPRIDAAFDADYIKVWCRPAEFPKIEKLIKEYDARAKVVNKTIVMKPKGGAARYLAVLKAQSTGNLKIEEPPAGVGQPVPTLLEDIWPEGTKAEDVLKLRSNPKTMPVSDNKLPPGVMPFEVDPQLIKDWNKSIARGLTGATADPQEDTPPATTQTGAATTPAAQPASAPQPTAKEARITPLPDGRLIISGDKGKVEDVQDAISLLEEDLAAGEVIRIFRFRFGDVTASARILEMMFNASAQMRGPAGLQQMMQQQQMQQMQMMQQMQNQQNQRRNNDDDGGGRGGRGGRGGAGSGGGNSMMDMMRGLTGGGGGGGNTGGRGGAARGQQGQQADRLRIATDISHNYIIVKCDESDLPEIRQLLRELDIPAANVDLKVFQLKNLNATETAANIKDVLGITDARQQRDRNRGGGAAMLGNPFGGGRGGMGGMGGAQNQFMELFTQQMVSMPGMEGGEGGAKIDSVQIVPNEITNSLLVSAPKEVVAIIDKVINELEMLEGQDVVVIRHFSLKQARVEDVEPLLQEVFDATAGGRGGAAGGRSGKTSPAHLGPVTIRGDTRNNTLIVSAQQKDLPVIQKQIELMDIEGDLAEAETYECQYGDAVAIAQTVTDIFAGGNRGGARSGRGGATAGGASTGVANDVRITAEGVTNTLIVFGSPEMRNKVLEQVKDLDERSKRDIQEVAVDHADPEKLADKLLAIFGGVGGSAVSGGARGAAGGGRGGRDAMAQLSGRIVVVGDKVSKKLLIRAPKPIFEQMADLCIALDQPDPGLQVRTFAVRHADAQSLVDSVKAAFLEYMTVARQSGEQGTSFDPFTVVADPRTNSIMVVGSEQTFDFVSTMLRVVDVETPKDQMKEFRIFTLADADAQVVADAINSFASGQMAPAGGANRGGPQGARGGTNPLAALTGGARMSAQTLNVQAVADAENNAVLVYGRPNDIETVETMVINKLETSLARQVKAVAVTQAEPSQIVSTIQPFLDETGPQAGGRPGQRAASGGPVLIPNDIAKRIVVRGTSAEIRKVEQLVAQFDDKSLIDQGIEIIPIQYGQDVVALAQTVEQLVNQGERQLAQQQNRQPREITIRGDEQSHTLLAYGHSSQAGMVKTLVRQLQDIHPTQPSTVVLKVNNLSATDVQNIINDLQQRRGGGNRAGSPFRQTGGTGGMNRQPGIGGGALPSRPPGGAPGGTIRPPQNQPQRPPQNRPTGGGGPGAQPSVEAEGARLWPSSEIEHLRGPILSYMGEPLLLTFFGAEYPAAMIFGEGDAAAKDASADNAADDVAATDHVAADPRVGRIAQNTHESARRDSAQRRAPRRNLSEILPVLFTSNMIQTDAAAQDQPPAARPPAPRPQPTRPITPPPAAQEPAVQRVAETPNAPEPAPQVTGSQPATQLTGISGQLRGDVLATPLDSKTVVITGDAQDVQFIEQILSLLEASAPSPVLEVIPLQHAKAAAIQQVVDQTMRALLEAMGGGLDRGDRYSIIAENRYNALIVSASEKNMETIRELISRLDQDVAEGTPKLIQLKNIQASEAADLLKPIIEQLKAVKGESQTPPPSVQPVRRSNAVMLIGNAAEIAELERILAAIDVEIPPETSFAEARLQIIDLKNALAEDMEKTLTTLITVDRAAGTTAAAAGTAKGESIVRRLRLTAPDGSELPALDLDRPIKIVPDKARNALVIFSHEKNMAALQSIVKTFDSLPTGEEIDVKSFVLQHAQAAKIAEALNKMFDDAKKAIGRPTELNSSGKEKGVMPPMPPGLAAQGLPFNVIVTPDPRSNTLIVIGRKPSVLLAAGLITEIDRPGTSLGLQPHMLALRNTDAVSLEKRLRDMLDKRMESMGGKDAAAHDNAVLMLDERSNSILVLAGDDTWKMIQSVATELDTLESRAFVTTRYRKLEYADAAKLGGLLQDVFDKKKEFRQSSNESGQKDTLNVLPDSRSNAIVLTGTKDYVDEAETLIRELDQAMMGRVEFKIRPMVLGSALTAAKLLDDMVKKTREQAGGAGGSGKAGQSTPVHIAADTFSNSLLLAAAKEDMVMLERWVDLLDRPAEFGRIQRIVPLMRGNAEELSKSIGDLFKQSGSSSGGTSGGGGPDFTIFADKTTNSVVISGPPQNVEEAVSLLKKMQDSTAPGGAVVKIFKLNQADAQDSGDLLRSILEGRAGSIGGTGNRSGSTSSGGTREDAVKQVMLLHERASGDGKAEMLKAFRAEVTVIDDLRTNSLVITAPADAMPLMESLVKAVDVPPDAAKIRVFPLRNSDATEMVTMLEKLIPNSSTGSSGSLSASGNRQGGDQERQLTLEGSNIAGGREQLSFTTDKRTNAVIAAGTSGYLDLVERLVYELDSQPIEDRNVFVYHPRNNKATEIQTMLADYSDKEKARLQELGEDISASAKSSREIVAIATEETNRLIISYDPRRQSEVLDLVRQLDQAPPQVMIQVLIVEVTMTNSLELGVEFAFQDLQFTKAGPNDTTTYDYVGGTDVGAAVGDLGGFTFTVTGADFNFLIRTLQSEGTLSVLSRPQIMALDNQEAKIEITNREPIVTGTTQFSGQTTTQTGYEEVGIKLTVTPHINPDGFVRMEVVQEVSDVAGSSTVAAGVTLPRFLKRIADTVVTVKDNETVVLGGLIRKREQVAEAKVPILGDVPGLGMLFRADDRSSEHTELLVILTPRVVRSIEDYRELSQQERDRTGVIPDEVLTSPLMQGLRIEPDQLLPHKNDDAIGAPRRAIPPAPAQPDDDVEIYGPLKKSAPKSTAPRPSEEIPHAEPATYDVPFTRVTK
jgi:type II secretion system protein D